MPGRRTSRKTISSKDRLVNTREQRPNILIVCEGEKTEPSYFQDLAAFHKLSTVKAIGVGRVVLSLVEYAEEMQGRDGKKYDEIWCVFDKDDFPADQFDNAVAKASNHKFLRCAWSHEAFELWYVLHFRYLDTGVKRHQYIDQLDDELKAIGAPPYKKNTKEFYTFLGEGRRDQAIAFSRRLCDQFEEKVPCSQRNPATTVHILVERLLRLVPK
jgi:hypothetical protein